MNMGDMLGPEFDRIERGGLIAGLVLVAIAIIDGAIRSPEQFFRSYLLAYVFWLGFPLGCTAFLMVHYLTGGKWGLPIKRPLEAAAATFPLLAVLIIPLLFGLGHLYAWANPATVAGDPTLQFKARYYLNVPFFLIRQLIYFSIWSWIIYRVTSWSSQVDRTGDLDVEDRLERMSGPALVLYGFTITFFSIDWVMSLEPHWFSTIFGMIFIVIQVQAAIAFSIIAARLLGAYEPVSTTMSADRFNDLGNLLLTFVMLWAYLAFSQFVIIWAGDLVKEIPWYLTRAKTAWAGVAVALIVLYFGVPFALLLTREVKRRVTVLAVVAGIVISLNFVDVYWMIVPSFHPTAPRFYLMDALLVLGMGCLWIAAFVWRLRTRPLLPLHDPRFEGALENGD